MMNIIKMLRQHYIKIVILIFFCLCLLDQRGFELYTGNDLFNALNFINQTELGLIIHFINVNSFYSRRRFWPTSKLGAILFKGDKIPDHNKNENRSFNILIWRHWEWLQIRHVFNFGTARENVSILEDCSVKNCYFTGDDLLIKQVDAVVVHLQKYDIPEVAVRNRKQRWIFLNDESPVNAFYDSRQKLKLNDLHNVFNWSMTYRNDADIPVPYGRTIPLEEPVITNPTLKDISTLVPNWELKQRDVPAALIYSNCGVKSRNNLLDELMKYMTIDVYGKCSKLPHYKRICRGNFRLDCNVTSQYLFYFALENSHCFQYLTEKVFHHAYLKGAVPIIFGPRYEDVRTLLPPNSFLFIDQDTNLQLLVQEIINLTKNEDLLLSMHEWRNHFKVVNEHGYFGTKSYHLCRLCEAMNYNDEREKILSAKDLKWFLDETFTCKKI